MAASSGIDRRRFIARSSAAAAAALAAPYFVPKSAFGAGDRVTTGHIGVGGQGTGNLKRFLENAVAVCDVDQTHAAKAAKLVEAEGRKCETFADYRRLLDRKDIDAVVISTPDHWHALATIDACQAGKDVYCEKPLSLTVAEGRKMVEAARSNQRIVQTGSQQRSDARFRRACEMVREGALGKIERVLVGLPKSNFGGPPVPDSNPPAELDYAMWLGPAPKRPYNAKRVHYNFRFFWDYSGGQMTNWGAHHIDIAQWGLGMDGAGPVTFEGAGEFHPQGWFEVTMRCLVKCTYANGVVLVVGQDQPDIPHGVTFEGERGRMFVDRKELTSDPAEIAANAFADAPGDFAKDGAHQKNFLECIKTRERPICDVEIGHRSASVCHLSNIAVRLGRKIEWDSAREQIVGDDEANRMLSRPYTPPWNLS